MFDKHAFRQEMHNQRQQPIQQTLQKEKETVDNASVSYALQGIIEACQPFQERFVLKVTARATLYFLIKLPPPMFFYVEHSSPFLLSFIGGEPDMKDRQPQKDEYAYRIRLCCACIERPMLDIDTLGRLYPHIIHTLYAEIMNRVMPPKIELLMKTFYRKTRDEVAKSQLLDVYLMCKHNNESVIEHLFPNAKNINPYIKNAIQRIVYEIGSAHDMKIEKAKLGMLSKSALF